jgi:signal transduction histidine kinase
MIRKIRFDLSAYSNGLLIAAIVLSFMALLAITASSRRETIGKILRLEALFIREDPRAQDWAEVLTMMQGPHTGSTGAELAGLLERYRLELEALPLAGDRELRRILGRIIMAYTEILLQREAAFNTLFYFLVIGILIQSLSLLFSLGRIRNARLEIRHQDYMLSMVQAAREQERRKLASYLHDSVIQDLGSLGLHPALRAAPDALALLNEDINKLRRVSYSLVPLHLEHTGLVEAVKELISEVFKQDGTSVDFTALGYEDALIKDDQRLILYRAIQEGLNNIRKYASAKRVELRLVAADSYLLLSLRDDGRGFDVAAAEPGRGRPGGGMGLALLEQQVRSIGAELSVESSPGSGTLLQIRLKIEKR